jgi:hypothetical protein
MKTIIPELSQLEDLDMNYILPILKESKIPESVIEDTCYDPAGKVPYRLYAYMSSTFDNGIILDIGTLFGSSSVSASFNPKNQVISYDVNDHIARVGATTPKKENIQFKEDDSIEWNKVKMIIIDTDHTGSQETEFVKFLIEKDWSGLLLLDDIHLNEPMKEFWNSFDDNIKMDLSNIGHGVNCSSSPYGTCGTGFVEFDLK